MTKQEQIAIYINEGENDSKKLEKNIATEGEKRKKWEERKRRRISWREKKI